MVVAVVEASRMVVSLPKISLQKFKLAVYEYNWIRKGALLRNYTIVLNDNNKLSLQLQYCTIKNLVRYFGPPVIHH